MQKCLKCNNKFKYGELFRQLYNIWGDDNSSLICSKCNAHHKPSRITSIIFIIFLFLPTIAFPNIHKYFGINRFLFVILWITLMVLLSPIYTRYVLKDEEK